MSRDRTTTTKMWLVIRLLELPVKPNMLITVVGGCRVITLVLLVFEV